MSLSYNNYFGGWERSFYAVCTNIQRVRVWTDERMSCKYECLD